MGAGIGRRSVALATRVTHRITKKGRAVSITCPIVIVGPTASGKSDLAMDLAESIGGEIINADAFQVYRGMDIGTAKVLPAERRGIPHHLIDILDIAEPFSVADFQIRARECAEEILGRGRVPVLVGGSGLYVRAFVDDLRFPGTDAGVRRRLEAELEAEGVGTLRDRLIRLDPAAAAAIEPNNARRIVRALEVIEITGEPFTATMPDTERSSAFPHIQIGVRVERNLMDLRIDRRVEAMWDAGLEDEVRTLDGMGLREAPTAARALGYPQCLSQLDGNLSRVEAIAETQLLTRRFARRQQRWFEKDTRVAWVQQGSTSEAIAAMDAQAERLHGRGA